MHNSTTPAAQASAIIIIKTLHGHQPQPKALEGQYRTGMRGGTPPMNQVTLKCQDSHRQALHMAPLALKILKDVTYVVACSGARLHGPYRQQAGGAKHSICPLNPRQRKFENWKNLSCREKNCDRF